jgi:hypothetical protein
MKKMMVLFAFVAVIGLYQARAQTATPGIDQREAVQHARIREGVATGELTRREAAQARHNQRSIRRSERRAKADGEVTARERANIQRKQNRASRQLRRNKHDNQERAGV